MIRRQCWLPPFEPAQSHTSARGILTPTPPSRHRLIRPLRPPVPDALLTLPHKLCLQTVPKQRTARCGPVVSTPDDKRQPPGVSLGRAAEVDILRKAQRQCGIAS
eukprot:232740-Chlamydomonas_euryale.AAC.5